MNPVYAAQFQQMSSFALPEESKTFWTGRLNDALDLSEEVSQLLKQVPTRRIF